MNFTVDEDRLLYSLALKQVSKKGRINWTKVWLGMPYEGKTKEQLRTRLKTLKRTYGSNLKIFSPCFFSQSSRVMQISSGSGAGCDRRVSTISISNADGCEHNENSLPNESESSHEDGANPRLHYTDTFDRIPSRNSEEFDCGNTTGIVCSSPVIAATEYLELNTDFSFTVDYNFIEEPSDGQGHDQISIYAHDAVNQIFPGIAIHDLRAQSASFDFHYGEIQPVSVSKMLAAIPTLQKSDTFVDIGSGVGNVVAQIAIETRVGHCIGIEFQPKIVQASRASILGAKERFPRLTNVNIFEDNIRSLGQVAWKDLQTSTVLFTNNLRFDHSTNEALENIAVKAEHLRHTITMDKLCCRHQSRCSKAFCSMWIQSNTLAVQVSWSDREHVAYLYKKRM